MDDRCHGGKRSEEDFTNMTEREDVDDRQNIKIKILQRGQILSHPVW
jgi:hypothetical protein